MFFQETMLGFLTQKVRIVLCFMLLQENLHRIQPYLLLLKKEKGIASNVPDLRKSKF
jgi:hypothetical protein